MSEQKLYVIQHYDETDIDSESAGYHKIGIADNPESRLSTLRGGTPYSLRLIAIVEIIGDPKEAEQHLHDLYVHSHVRREWFKLIDGEIEAFKELSEVKTERLRKLKSELTLEHENKTTPILELINE